MPTLLGLIGNRDPYFAFGRDVLNEPRRPRWSVSYDGEFRALTDSGALLLDDAGAPAGVRPVELAPETSAPTAVTVPADTADTESSSTPDAAEAPATGSPAAEAPAVDSLRRGFQALLQQYYQHIENKNYTVHD